MFLSHFGVAMLIVAKVLAVSRHRVVGSDLGKDHWCCQNKH